MVDDSNNSSLIGNLRGGLEDVSLGDVHDARSDASGGVIRDRQLDRLPQNQIVDQGDYDQPALKAMSSHLGNQFA
jgi:hypothetical protein